MKQKDLTNTFMIFYDYFKLRKPFGFQGLNYKIFQRFNSLTGKFFNLNFHPLEVVSR